MQAPPTAVAVGDWQREEFRLVRAAIDPAGRWPTTASLAELLERASESGRPPELVLLAAARPGGVEQGDVDRLQAAWPLTRLVIVAGAWCEGELRSGRPPVGAVRLYWHELTAWWRHASSQLATGQAPLWSAPLDNVRSGQSMTTHRDDSAAVAHRGVLAVDAADYAVFETLAAGLANYGWKCQWRPWHRPEIESAPGDAPFAAGVWNGGQLDGREVNSLATFCARLAPARAAVVVLLDYPRAEHVGIAKEAGAGAILGKPYQLAALADELRRLTGSAI